MSETEDDPFASQNSDEFQAKTNRSLTKPPATVTFRLLCDVHLAGGVIGNSGSIVKRIESQTGTKISFESPLRYCPERVINIAGSSQIHKEISIGDEEMVSLSQVQEGLVRVFDRILEVKWSEEEEKEDNSGGGGGGDEIVRLLAPKCRLGAFIGKGGEVVGARRTSGAIIRVRTNHQLPACAAPGEEVIQITGTLMAVKKALLDVSCCLQEHAPKKGGSSVQRSAVENGSSCHSSYPDVEKIDNLDKYGVKRKVVFRLLCSNRMAGCVIGKGACNVKSLEHETGASIKFTPAVSKLKGRVAIISSLENADPLHSPALTAVVRVFARCMEVMLDQDKSVIARILVSPSEVDCLMDQSGIVASDIISTLGVDIRLMNEDLGSEDFDDDVVLQITGGYKNVERALSQVTGRIRRLFFSRMGLDGAYHSYDSNTAMPNNHRKAGVEAPKLTVEVVVPAEAFSSIYGENGSNLALLKEISGATIEFKDPSPGESSGKVILSGTPERIQKAQSLLQTFIIF